MKLYLLLIFLSIFFINSQAQWIRVNSVPEFMNIPSLAVSGSTIYAGAENRIYISTDNGDSWNITSVINSYVDFVSALLVVNGKMIAGTYLYGVFESADGGQTWTEINDGLNGKAARTISCLLIRGNKLYAGTYGAGIFTKDLNTSGTWIPFNSGIPPNLSFNVNSLILLDQTLYAGAGGNGYYYTNSSESSGWTELQFGVLNGEPLSLYDIIKTTEGEFLISSYGIYKSTDSGLSWEPFNLSNGLISRGGFIRGGNSIYLYLMRLNKTIWYRSADEGLSWDLFAETAGVNTLSAAFLNNRIYDGRLYGLWYYPLETSNVKDNITGISDFYLSSNYPNPFNPSTKIQFKIPEGGYTQLKVFNNLGEEISVLVQGEKASGSYEVVFNADNLPGGVYFYRLQSGRYISTGKMILLK
jgi:hypothetical protein